jgi:hypothetical protein
MNQCTRMAIGLMLVAAVSACSPSQPRGEPEAVQSDDAAPAPQTVAELPESPPADPAPKAPPTGSMVVYACNDGSGVTVTYDEYTALVKLPSGSTTLSRADAASGGGEVAYLSEELSLYRTGDAVRLEVAGKSRICTGRS